MSAEVQQTDSNLPAYGAAAAGAGALAGFGAGMPLDYSVGPQLNRQTFINRLENGDIVLTGESGKNSLVPDSLKFKKDEFEKMKRNAKQVVMGGEGVSRKRALGMLSKRVQLAADKLRTSAYLRLIPTFTGSPYNHGGIASVDPTQFRRSNTRSAIVHITDDVLSHYAGSLIDKDTNAIILRPKTEKLRKGMKAAVEMAEKAVLKSPGYSSVNAVISTLQSAAIPDSVMRIVVGKAKTLPPEVFCTNFPAILYEAVGSGSPSSTAGSKTLARHLLGSKKLEAIGHTGKSFDRLARFKYSLPPRLLSAATMGLGAYGAYRGGKALYDHLNEKKSSKSTAVKGIVKKLTKLPKGEMPKGFIPKPGAKSLFKASPTGKTALPK